MKTTLISLSLVAISFIGYSQAKPKSDSIPPVQQPKKFAAYLTQNQWQAILNSVSASESLSAKQAAELNQDIINQLQPQLLKAQADSTSPKK